MIPSLIVVLLEDLSNSRLLGQILLMLFTFLLSSCILRALITGTQLFCCSLSQGVSWPRYSPPLSVIFLSQPSAIQIGPVVRYHDVLSLVGLYFLVLLLSL